MALGGGTWVTQNKVLPGAYINVVSRRNSTIELGERGIVAVALPIGKSKGEVIEITVNQFVSDSSILGFAYTDVKAKALREIFAHATRAVIYDTGDGTGVTVANIVEALDPYEFNVLCAYTNTAADITSYITAVKAWREAGKRCQAVVYNASTAPDHEGIINVVSANDSYDKETFTGDGTTKNFTIEAAPDAIDKVLVAGSALAQNAYSYAAGTLTINTTPADGAVIEARYNTAPEYAAVAWVAGAEAGCELNESCTNMVYDGELNIITELTNAQLEQGLLEGKFMFHRVYGDIRVLEDINSMTTTTDEKSDDFKYNQTMRVVDQSANDMAKLFSLKYLGRIPNDQAGRDAFWGDVVAYNRNLETIRAIEDFDSGTVIVKRGNTKKAIVVEYAITPVNAMSQLYLTIVVL